MGQFSMQEMAVIGSNFGANQHAGDKIDVSGLSGQIPAAKISRRANLAGMIYASDFESGIKAKAHFGDHAQRLVNHGMGEHWECDCEEYRQPKPNTPGAFCEHTQRAAAAYRGPLST